MEKLREARVLYKAVALRELKTTVSFRRKRTQAVAPLRERKKHNLEELLAGITSENSHAEVETGSPVGGEIFW